MSFFKATSPTLPTPAPGAPLATLIVQAQAAEAEAVNTSGAAHTEAQAATRALRDIDQRLATARQTLAKASDMETARAAQGQIEALERERAAAAPVAATKQAAARQAEDDWKVRQAETKRLKDEAATIRDHLPLYRHDVVQHEREVALARGEVLVRERRLDAAQAAVDAKLARLRALTGAGE